MLSSLVPYDALAIAATLVTNVICMVATYVVPVVVVLYVTEKLWRRGLIEGISRRAVFITGCDSGFGNGLARHLDSLGVPVYAACLTQEGRKRLEEQCSNRVNTFLMNVTSTDDIQRAYDFVQTHIFRAVDGRYLWGVVNNAGIIGDFGTTEMYNKSDFVKVMDVNFFGQVEVIRTFLPMLKKSEGRIVNIASIGGVYPYATLGFPCPYTPSKYAVLGYSEALREDLRRWGINVSILLPGGHRTDIVSIDGQLHRFRAMWNRLSQDTRDEYGQDWIDTVCSRYSQLDSVIKSMPGVEPVVEAYTHALFSHRPSNRYVVGIDARVMNVIKLLPQCIINFLIHGPLNMMPLPLPAVLQSDCGNTSTKSCSGPSLCSNTTTKPCGGVYTPRLCNSINKGITGQAVCSCSVLCGPVES